VDLRFSGALSGSFREKTATCNQMSNPNAPMSSVQVRGQARDLGTFNLTVIAEAGDWQTPSVVLSLAGAEPASFAYARTTPPGESITLSPSPPGLELDLTLKEVAGQRTVRVTGRASCP
jgi:hypothetical protein